MQARDEEGLSRRSRSRMEKMKGTIRSRSRTIWMMLDGMCLSEPEFLLNHLTTCKGRIQDRSV